MGAILAGTVGGIEAQILTNLSGAAVGAPPTPSRREPFSPQTGAVTNAAAMTNAVPPPLGTNRIIPGTNGLNDNLKSSKWFNPKGTNGHYRGTNWIARPAAPDSSTNVIPGRK